MDEESWIAPISMKMVLSHHENMAGTGFPMKQKNKELECRIIQACDAFDSLISGMAVSYTHLDVYKRQGHGPC